MKIGRQRFGMSASGQQRNYSMNNKLILYSIDDKAKNAAFEKLCREMGISTKRLTQSDMTKPVGTVAGIKGIKMSPDSKKPEGIFKIPEILIFCGINNSHLDTFLAKYKEYGIAPVQLKAIVTSHNISWSIYSLIQELQRERIAIMLGKK